MSESELKCGIELEKDAIDDDDVIIFLLTQVVDGDWTLYFGTRPRDLGYGAVIVVPSGAWPWG